jgi:hypothetical protein
LTQPPGAPISAGQGVKRRACARSRQHWYQRVSSDQSWLIHRPPRRPRARAPAAPSSTGRGARACATPSAKWKRRFPPAIEPQRSPPWPKPSQPSFARRKRASATAMPRAGRFRGSRIGLPSSANSRSAARFPAQRTRHAVDCHQSVADLSRRPVKSAPDPRLAKLYITSASKFICSASAIARLRSFFAQKNSFAIKGLLVTQNPGV